MNFWTIPKRLLVIGVPGLLVALLYPAGRSEDSSTYFLLHLSGLIVGLFMFFPCMLGIVLIARRLIDTPLKIPRMDAIGLRQITTQFVARWFVHAPTSGLSPAAIQIHATAMDPKTARHRFAIGLIGPMACVFIAGVAFWAQSMQDIPNGLIFGMLRALGVLLTFFSLMELLPTRNGSMPTSGKIVLKSMRDRRYFETLISRNQLVLIEFMYHQRPRDFDPAIMDILAAGSAPDQSLSLQVGSMRLLYLVALDRADLQETERLHWTLHQLCQRPVLAEGDREAVELVLAFHAAYVQQSAARARIYLDRLRKRRALRATPLFVLVDGMVSALDGKRAGSARLIAKAEALWSVYRIVSGTTQMWIEICGRFLDAAPDGVSVKRAHRPALARLVPLSSNAETA